MTSTMVSLVDEFYYIGYHKGQGRDGDEYGENDRKIKTEEL